MACFCQKEVSGAIYMLLLVSFMKSVCTVSEPNSTVVAKCMVFSIIM